MGNVASGFDAQRFLDSAGTSKQVVDYRRAEVVFSQGDRCESVMYVQKGGVKLSARSRTGREAVLAMLGPGEFFGEGCLADQPVRLGSATAITRSTVLAIEKKQMVRLLHAEHGLSDRFISHLLSRKVHIEQDLVDQLSNSTEMRVARALLVLACYGRQDRPRHVVSKVSQDALAKMVGTTRSRVNFFMNKFKRLGFIGFDSDREAGVRISSSLLSVVLHE